MRDGFTGIELTEVEAKLARARSRFLELVAEGTPENLAGFEVGWSWFRTKAQLSLPEFRDAVDAAIERADDSIEEALYKQARRGNVAAIQMWLYNRRADRWKDIRRIEVDSTHTIHVEVVDAVKASAIELLREHGVGAMRELGDITRAIEAASSE